MLSWPSYYLTRLQNHTTRLHEMGARNIFIITFPCAKCGLNLCKHPNLITTSFKNKNSGSVIGFSIFRNIFNRELKDTLSFRKFRVVKSVTNVRTGLTTYDR